MAEKKYLDDAGLQTFKDNLVAQIPSKTSDLTNDSGYITDAVSTVADQGLTETEQTDARNNINAQVAGDYADGSEFTDWQAVVTTLKNMVYNREISRGILTDSNALLVTDDGYAIEGWSSI